MTSSAVVTPTKIWFVRFSWTLRISNPLSDCHPPTFISLLIFGLICSCFAISFCLFVSFLVFVSQFPQSFQSLCLSPAFLLTPFHHVSPCVAGLFVNSLVLSVASSMVLLKNFQWPTNASASLFSLDSLTQGAEVTSYTNFINLLHLFLGASFYLFSFNLLILKAQTDGLCWVVQFSLKKTYRSLTDFL